MSAKKTSQSSSHHTPRAFRLPDLLIGATLRHIGLVLAVFGILALVPAFIPPPLGAQGQSAPQTLAGTWRLAGSAAWTAGEPGGAVVEGEGDKALLVLAPGALAYTSSIHATEFEFIAVGADWDADLSDGAALRVEIRTSGDRQKWTEWVALPEMVDGPSAARTRGSDLGFLTGRYLQARLSVSGGPARIRSFTLTYLDTRSGPTAEQAAASAQAQGLAVGQPAIISRAAWGANESYRFANGQEVWPLEYMHPQGLVVHHSGPPELFDQDPAAWIRTIYYYHAVTKGWGDIGYNYIVDKQGRLYQGRIAGSPPAGMHVKGGHALEFNCCTIGIVVLGNYHPDPGGDSWPTDASKQGLVDISAWLVDRFGLDPLGQSFIYDHTVYNISGHRDVNLNHTECPGDRLYPFLPELRRRAADALQVSTPVPTATPTTIASPTPFPFQTPIPVPTPGLPPPGECGERVTNGDFEIDNGAWVRNRALFTTYDKHAGDRALFIGLLANDPNANVYASAYQEVSIPADAGQITLSFWVRRYSDDTSGDLQFVRLFDGASAVLLPGDQGNFTSNSKTWELKSYDLTDTLAGYRGRTLTLYFGVINDGANGKTYMRLDDVSLTACRQASTPTPTPTPTLTPSLTPSPTPTTCDGVCPTDTPTVTPTPTRTPWPIGTWKLFVPLMPKGILEWPTR